MMNRPLLVAVVGFGVELLGAEPAQRSDLGELGSRIVCQQGSREPAFDAQVIIKKVVGAVREKALISMAKSLAHSHEHLGFGVGMCHPGQGFIVSAPAPISWPELLAAGGRQPHCRRLSQIFQGTTSKVGVRSVTCYRHDKDRTSSNLWFLIPEGKSSLAEFEVPFVSSVVDQESFVVWLNHVRKAQGHRPILMKSRLGHLNPHFTLAHRKSFVARLRGVFANRGERFVGELRVVAESWAAAAKLLWRSPTHRRLLLSKQADALYSYLMRGDNGSSLFVFWISAAGEEAA